MDPHQKLSELLVSISTTGNKTSVLIELKTLLLSLNNNIIRESTSDSSLQILFDCLESGDREEVNLASDVLDRVLRAADPSALLQQLHLHLLSGLQHPANEVKQLCLSQLKWVSESDPQQLLSYEDVLILLVRLLGADMNLAKQAAYIILTLGRCGTGAEVFLTGNILVELRQVFEISDIIRFRVCELIIDLARISPEALAMADNAGILKQLVNEVYKDDILVQLNCLELLTRLALCEHGLGYMDQQGIVGKLDEMMHSVDSDPLLGFLMPGLVKFFGNVAHLHPKKACDRFEHFLKYLFTSCQSPDVSARVLAIETVGFIAKTPEGKRVMERYGSELAVVCKQSGQLVKDSPQEAKIRVLEALGNLFFLPVSEQTTELLSLCDSWFKLLSPQPLDLLLDTAKQPFINICCGSLAVINILAMQPWAQHVLNSHPGFTEYLLDRSTEKEKEGKEAKYDIVQTLVDSPTAMEIFGRVYFVRLKEYQREGPFYVRTEAAVAMEGAN